MVDIYVRPGETLDAALSRKARYRERAWRNDRAEQRRICYQVIKHDREECKRNLAKDWKRYKSRRNNIMDFSKFDKQVDLEGLKQDIAEAAENGGGDFKEVPLGTYEVAITKLELSESSKNDPMVKIWFKILDGEFKNSIIFMNQVVTRGFQIHIVDEFLKSLETDVDIYFESYSQYNEVLLDVFEAVNGKLEFALKYGKNDKGFNTYEITEVFEVE